MHRTESWSSDAFHDYQRLRTSIASAANAFEWILEARDTLIDTIPTLLEPLEEEARINPRNLGKVARASSTLDISSISSRPLVTGTSSLPSAGASGTISTSHVSRLAK